MSGPAKYFIVEAKAMPEIFRKVAEAKRLLETGEEKTVNGAAQAQIDWYDSYLPALMGVGTGVLVLGAVLSYLWRADGKKRVIGWYLTGGGAFLALSALLIWRLNAPMVTFLTIAVFAAMILGILWSLYDRECAISLTILGVSLIFLWVCRRGMEVSRSSSAQ